MYFLLKINITSRCNFVGLSEFLFPDKQSPETLKTLSLDACVAGIGKISIANLETIGNLDKIISFDQKL
jgi:hypothetical protein